MEIDLAAAARSRTDEELVAMVERDHRDFTAEALDAGRAELRARGVSWVEPDAQPANDVARPPSAAASVLTVFGGTLLLIALVNLIWRGVSLPSLAFLVPGAALLLRSMKGR